MSKKSSEEPSSASQPEKKPRETVAELRQRMQQAKKAAANKEPESDIQIFVSNKAVTTEEAPTDHVIDNSNSCNIVSSSGISLNGSDNQQSSQRKQWEINEVKMDVQYITSIKSLTIGVPYFIYSITENIGRIKHR